MRDFLDLAVECKLLVDVERMLVKKVFCVRLWLFECMSCATVMYWSKTRIWLVSSSFSYEFCFSSCS